MLHQLLEIEMPPATATAILVLLAQTGSAQVDIRNTNSIFKASNFVETSTANVYPPTGSKYS
jgi:hypothetical protein